MENEKTLLESVEEVPVAPSLENVESMQVEAPSNAGEGIKDFFEKVLKADTGEGSIESYIEHPLNFSKSEGLAQVLRGITGIFGNLELALIDVLMGFLKMSKEKGVQNVG